MDDLKAATMEDRVAVTVAWAKQTAGFPMTAQRNGNGARQSPDMRSRAMTFVLFLIPHIIAAVLAPIQDCDEVFNYWEATHYLNHGYGLQTWEYSPVYAIRSWAYASLHAILVAPFTLLSSAFGSKVVEFYALRILLAVICASCETKLFQAIEKAVSPRVARIFMLVLATSCGMFHASTAYLPSSFAMYTAMLGVAEFVDWQESGHLSRGILWFAIGTTLGWPFVGVLVVAFVLVEAGYAVKEQRMMGFVQGTTVGGLESLLVALLQLLIDSYFYGKWILVPLNIVLYNVLADSSKGPDIYGTEPWHFYFRNLLLNFNVFFVLALITHPLLLLDSRSRGSPAIKQPFVHNFNLTAAFYIWLTIFSLQPHKEERFMYPAYPLLAINAAYSLHILLRRAAYMSERWSALFSGPKERYGLLISALLLSGISLSMLRSAGLVTAYSAPLKVYAPLRALAQPGDTVCVGKEWYRFPSSYFLPNGVKGKFIKSSFDGLLPGEFPETAKDQWNYAGTRIVPDGMNDGNKEDFGKYTDISQCTFLIDSQVASSVSSKLEPDYIADDKNWQPVVCERFLDVGATPTIGRLIWTPDIKWLPRFLQRRWGKYCLLKRRP